MRNAILVGVSLPVMEYDLDYSLKELENLAKANDIKAIEKVSQKMEKPSPKYYIGSGKVEEIKMMLVSLDCNLVIFDDELSPSQLRNLEKALECEVMDRSLLILNIFKDRAKTTEAILEINLARLKYMLPRLVGINEGLSRQGGGTNAKGAGETQLELDRRHVLDSITKLNQKLLLVKRNRESGRLKREKTDIPIVSLVGYTNAGKSTTFNTILEACKVNDQKKVLEKDQLFATLGTSVRKVTLPNKQEILLIDTVGFVSKLPPLLVNSFRSTLEEIINSSLIIHVIDASSPYYPNQIQVTRTVLEEIGVKDIQEIYLFNKMDKVNKNENHFYEHSISYSNKTKMNLDLLLKKIQDLLLPLSNTLVDVKIPLKAGKEISLMEAYGIIKMKIINNEFIYYKAYVPNTKLKFFEAYIEKED